MPLWNARSVQDVPGLAMSHWSVRELPDGDRHFVGYNLTEGEGRVSSKILSFDPRTMTGTTRSGRKYTLLGTPGVNMDAEYVWEGWARINSVKTFEDVSDEYVEAGLKEAWIAEGRDPTMFPTLGVIDENDMVWARQVAERLGYEKSAKDPNACCEDEQRNINGGCDNCGDPCL